MLSGIQKFQAKYNNKNSMFAAGSPVDENEGNHEESSKSIKTTRKKSPKEERINALGKTIADNFAGFKKNGRTMNQTHFGRLAITQVTTPIVKKTKDSAKTLEPMNIT